MMCFILCHVGLVLPALNAERGDSELSERGAKMNHRLDGLADWVMAAPQWAGGSPEIKP